MTSPYDALGVARDATPEQIEAAWRKKRSKLHPDRAGDTMTNEFQMVKLAYEILIDDERRARYDAGGATGEYQDTHAQDLNALALLFLQAIDGGAQDVLAVVRQRIQAEAREARRQAQECRQRAQRQRAAVARLRHKTAADLGLLGALLLGNAEQGERAAQTHDEAAQRADALLALIVDYHYDAPRTAAPAAPWMGRRIEP